MKNTLIIFLMILNVPVCFSQWSIGLNAGVAEIRRDIPDAGLDNLHNYGLSVDLNYSPDSSSVIFNLSPYLHYSSRSEIHTSTSHYASNFHTPVMLMSGIGSKSHLGTFVEVNSSLQLGYWYTRSEHYYYHSHKEFANQYEDFEREFSQFAIGPKIKISFGKKKLKGTLTFENYFLTASPDVRRKTFGRERLTRLSMGLSYKFCN